MVYFNLPAVVIVTSQLPSADMGVHNAGDETNRAKTGNLKLNHSHRNPHFFITLTAGTLNSLTISRAASRSNILLKESSLP